MRQLIAPLLVVSVFAAPAWAQEAAKPGAEHERIGYFAGTWRSEGETMPSPFGPGGTMTATDTCEWFTGGFQLVCRGEVTGPRGASKTAAVWSYDPAQQAYTYYGYNSLGNSFYVLGHVEGKVWTWKAEFPMEGATMQMRATITEEPPAAYTYKLEMSADGVDWTLAEQGRSTKKQMR
jgi:hypothetical protein